MATNMCITRDAINEFTRIDEKKAILQAIDDIVETSIKSGFAMEFQLNKEIGLLFDIRRLIDKLPFEVI